jgi:hypothetical protein
MLKQVVHIEPLGLKRLIIAFKQDFNTNFSYTEKINTTPMVFFTGNSATMNEEEFYLLGYNAM